LITREQSLILKEMNPYRLRAYILLLIVSVIWAIAGPVIKFVLSEIPPLLFLTYRFLLSSAFAIPYFIIAKPALPKKKLDWIYLLVYSLLTSSVTLGMLFFGLNNTTVLDMSIITLAVPLVIAIAGIFFLNEHITKREWGGMTVAIFGTALTIIEPLLSSKTNGVRLSGNLLIAGYVAVNAVSVVISKKLLRKGVSPSLMTNFAFIVGFLSLAPFLLFSSSLSSISIILKGASATSHLGVAYMALLSGTLAYWMSNKAQKSVEIGEAALFSYLYPLLSIPIAVLWLNEIITPIFIVGAVIILSGVIVAEYKKPKKNK